jgi:hypothetical protein
VLPPQSVGHGDDKTASVDRIHGDAPGFEFIKIRPQITEVAQVLGARPENVPAYVAAKAVNILTARELTQLNSDLVK